MAVVYGGVGYKHQHRALDRGASLVVACPGRLEDLLQMNALTLEDVTCVVIDEADRMADMGFLPRSGASSTPPVPSATSSCSQRPSMVLWRS
ncbi:MAG: DEAD/DEAH box helicase [Microthrixaceae bacterium]